MPWRHALTISALGLPVLALGAWTGYFVLIWVGASLVVVPLVQCLWSCLERPARAYLKARRVKETRVWALPDEALDLAASFIHSEASLAPEDVESHGAKAVELMDLLARAGWLRRWSYEGEPRWQAHPGLAALISLERERRERELLKPGPRLGPRSRPSSFAERTAI